MKYRELWCALALIATSTVQAATFTVTIPEQHGEYYSNSFPRPAVQATPVSFAAQIPAGESIVSIVAAGSFGNSFNPSSAPVNVFLNNIPVASCTFGAPCVDGAPSDWSYTFSPLEIAAFNSGTVALSYVQTNFYIVNLSPTLLTVTTARAAVIDTPQPVPAVGAPALMFGALGLFGVAGMLTRRRKVS